MYISTRQVTLGFSGVIAKVHLPSGLTRLRSAHRASPSSGKQRIAGPLIVASPSTTSKSSDFDWPPQWKVILYFPVLAKVAFATPPVPLLGVGNGSFAVEVISHFKKSPLVPAGKRSACHSPLTALGLAPGRRKSLPGPRTPASSTRSNSCTTAFAAHEALKVTL